ncbi:MAG: YkgJ family cysteine cluster protein [Firmicutes bacterium]|nr:YkgJ family cysteine cluster protein [Bacillota bacterium]
MIKNQKYTAKNLDQNFVSKQSAFKFECEGCGDCCRNIAPEDKILLSTVDIYRIANILDMEMSEVIEKYCDMVPGRESMLPLIIMKERLDGSCIFLKKGKCSIHEGKPLVCAMNPLGRILFLNDETQKHEFHYFIKEFTCGRSDNKITVQEWLDKFDVEKYDECVKMYKELGKICSNIMHSMSTDEERQQMFAQSFYFMYINYEKDKDLYEQLVVNTEFLKESQGEKQ